jgi:hypothetical protein
VSVVRAFDAAVVRRRAVVDLAVKTSRSVRKPTVLVVQARDAVADPLVANGERSSARVAGLRALAVLLASHAALQVLVADQPFITLVLGAAFADTDRAEPAVTENSSVSRARQALGGRYFAIGPKPLPTFVHTWTTPPDASVGIVPETIGPELRCGLAGARLSAIIRERLQALKAADGQDEREPAEEV